MRQKIFFVFKVIISVSLLSLLFTKVHFQDFLTELHKIPPGYFLLALVIMAGDWWISAERWGVLMSVFGLAHRTRRLFFNILTGMFYVVVLPAGKIAGDVVRAYQIANVPQTGEPNLKTAAFLSVFIDRGVGALAFLLFAAMYFLAGHEIINTVKNPALVGGGVIFLSLVGLLLIFSQTLDFLFRPLFYLFKKITIFHQEESLAYFNSLLKIIRSHKRKFLWALGISIIVVALSVVPLYLFSLALKLSLSFWSFGFFVSLSTLLTIVPITVAGIGLREGGMVYLLVQAGIPAEAALAVSLLNLAVILALSLIGGLLEFYYHFLKPKHEI